jgi:hypothetical protein
MIFFTRFVCSNYIHKLDAWLISDPEADTLLFDYNLQFFYFMKVCYPEFTVETLFSSKEK